jgi:hypothetical protein
MVATMIGMPDFGPLDTHSGFTLLNHYVGSNRNDQPWIRTGPSNHVYVAFNDLGQFNPGNGRTASVNVSTDGGSNYTTVSLDRVGAAVGQDDPAVRVAVNGSRVYAVFDRCTSTVENGANGSRFDSQLVVVRSDNGGADSFIALGAGGIGVTAATHIGVFANTQNTVLTLGQERIAGGDLAIAVDPMGRREGRAAGRGSELLRASRVEGWRGANPVGKKAGPPWVKIAPPRDPPFPTSNRCRSRASTRAFFHIVFDNSLRVTDPLRYA